MKLPAKDVVSDQPLDFQDVLQLVELMKSTSQFSEFKLRAGNIELELRRGPPPAASNVAAAPHQAQAPMAAPAPAASAVEPAPATPQAATPKPAARPTDRAHDVRQGIGAGDVVKAPMVGTVYLAPEPGEKPFVEVGQPVEAGTQLCIVEVMKLMNSVTAGRKGVVSQILVGDAETVEFGQPLFVITPV